MAYSYLRCIVTILFFFSAASSARSHTCPVRVYDAGEDDAEVILRISQSIAEVTTSRGRCGGALVAPSFVLSSNSCDTKVGDKVRIGKKNALLGETLNVTYIHKHRTESIVLLELNASSTQGKPFQLQPESELKSETRVRAASFNKQRVLKTADSMVITAEECRKSLPPKKIRLLEPRQEVCSSRPNICPNKTLCAGSPVVKYNSTKLVLSAIANAPYANIPPLCSLFPKTAVFTRISPFIPWIQAKTGTLAENVYVPEVDEKKERRGFPRWAAIALGIVCSFFLLTALLNIIVTTITNRREAKEREQALREAEETPVITIEESTNGQAPVPIRNVSSPPPSPPKPAQKST